MGWAEELTEENFYAIYDVALDIRADFQHGQPPCIPMVPSLIKFSILMPADGINMRDRYGNLRWKAMQFLKKKGVVHDIDIQQHGHRWHAIAALKVDSESFNETFATLESELRRRRVHEEAMGEVPKSMEKNKQIESPEFEKVTLL